MFVRMIGKLEHSHAAGVNIRGVEKKDLCAVKREGCIKEHFIWKVVGIVVIRGGGSAIENILKEHGIRTLCGSYIAKYGDSVGLKSMFSGMI